MDSFMVGAQLLLAAVFAVAGVAKLFDLPGSRRAVAEFGVPTRLASVAGTVLPLAELAIAVALVLHPSARWGALAAAALLATFSAGITYAMLRGRAPDCHCFGQVHSAPAGPRTLARNVVLAALAVVVVWRGPGPAIDEWVGDRSTAELVAIGLVLGGLAVAALVWFVWRWWSYKRAVRRFLEAPPPAPSAPEPEGLPVGTTAPEFALSDARGASETLESLRARGRPVVLVFSDPTCAPSRHLLPLVARWHTALAERVTIAVVMRGTLDDASVWEERGVTNVLLDPSSEVFDAFRVSSTPKAIGVAQDGTIAAAPAGGLHMPEVLIRIMIKRASPQHTVVGPTPASPAVVQVAAQRS
jgi:uncharacterized membrane protein YphA (DoxX/SURF4 family)